MQNRIKHLMPEPELRQDDYPIEELHKDYIDSGRGCPHCHFPFSAPDDEGDETCGQCDLTLAERWESGDEHLYLVEELVAVKGSDTEEFRPISSTEELYPGEIASRIIILRLPSSHVPGKHGLYPFNPMNINLN